jgi:hypothetical protein
MTRLIIILLNDNDNEVILDLVFCGNRLFREKSQNSINQFYLGIINKYLINIDRTFLEDLNFDDIVYMFYQTIYFVINT